MPREVIGPRDEFHVDVGWHRESGMLQIATVIPEPQTNAGPKNLAALVASWEDGARDPENPDGGKGLYASLDRAAVNDLIRVLRRARDQAFGRDE